MAKTEALPGAMTLNALAELTGVSRKSLAAHLRGLEQACA